MTSPHLTEKEVSSIVLGEEVVDERRHLARCGGCRDEIEYLECVLSDFKAAVRERGRQECHPLLPLVLPRQPARAQASTFRWTMAASALLLIIGSLDHLGRLSPQPVAEPGDTALLMRLDQEISETIPGPMEPLTQLLSREGGDMAAPRRVEASDMHVQ